MGIILRVFSVLLIFVSSFSLAGQENKIKHHIHVVKPGETLYGIAQKYQVSIEELMQFNEEINKMKAIKPGARLLVPDRRAIAEQEKPAPASLPVKDTSRSQYIYHEVQKQETLYSLSKQYGVTVERLMAENPIIKTEGLKAGFLLRVPKEKAESAQAFIAENDASYHLHSVQSQETAYSLGKNYKITIDSLYILNPEIKGGLKLGQLIRLPKNRARYAPKETLAQQQESESQQAEKPIAQVTKPHVEKVKDTASADADYMLYKVKGGDTFFNLKQRYFVEQEELVKINPELEKGLIVGKYIIIPKKQEAAEINWLDKILNQAESNGEVTKPILSGETVTKKDQLNLPESPTEAISVTAPTDTMVIDTAKQYRIAVLLPFRSSRYQDSLDAYSFFPHRDTEMASQFYFGLKLAADSLAKKGMNLGMVLYDTEGDLRKTKEIGDEIKNKSFDLVIGPAYNKNSEYIADLLKESATPVLSPLSKSVDIIGRPNLIKMVPDEEAKSATIAKLLNGNFSEANVLFAHCGSKEQEESVEAILARLQPREDAFVKTMASCEDLASQARLRENLAMSGTKVVVLMSDDAVFISDMISKLYSLRDTSIYVIGSPAVLKSPTVEYSYLNALHFTTYEVIKADFNTVPTKRFIKNYRETFKDEPSNYAFQGYDAGLYFLDILWRKGPYFLGSLSGQEKLSTGYEFERNENDGFRNSYFIHSSLRSFKLRRLKAEGSLR